MNYASHLPEETEDQIRCKVNAYNGDCAELEFKRLVLLEEVKKIERAKNEIHMELGKLLMKLRDKIMSRSFPLGKKK